ncbi:PTS fructose transporter subunit IIC [Virgibacillus necropolis]|uniref:PTS system, fructose subfamily, IIC subunit n=1 Tax=Virgibacillus necropolis TaxID=163877 RepID=A0A221M9H4_9BACI|nr:PTS fructose transporter subunit IIC [Virgibacillus necropolis]ASN04298.1 PTS system, fructose subfamily, IIC subunit [Virgibacillus necropolis]
MKNIKKHLMTGVSYMIPIVVAGGILLSLGVIIGVDTSFGKELINYGVWTLGMMVPMISGFIAYSMADRPGIAVGLASGVFANELGTGYIGGILVGFFAGWITNQLKKIPMHPNIAVIKPIMIIPVLGVGASALFMYFISIPLEPAMTGLENWLVSLEGSNLLFLGFIIAAMMAFDMGGPVNKIALAFCYATLAEGIYAPMAACWVGIMAAPMGLSLATLIFPKRFSKSEKGNAFPAAFMGSLGITEGAIPYAVATPLKVIPVITISSGIGGGLALLLGASSPIPAAIGIWGLPFVYQPLMLLLGLVVAVVIIALAVGILRKESDADDNDDVGITFE